MKKLLPPIAVGLFLAACGGGGSDQGTVSSGSSGSSGSAGAPNALSTPGTGGTGGGASSTEGLFAGTSDVASTPRADVLVLDDGTIWIFYGVSGTNNTNSVRVAETGRATFNGNNFTMPLHWGGGTASGTDDGTTITGVIKNGSGTPVNSFTAQKVTATSSYNYNQAATLPAIAGTWTLETGGFAGSSIGVDGTGRMTLASNAAGVNCTLNVTFTPRPSGKNVYNASFVQSGGGCANGALTGVGLLTTDIGGKQHLVAVAPSSSGTPPFLVVGLIR